MLGSSAHFRLNTVEMKAVFYCPPFANLAPRSWQAPFPLVVSTERSATEQEPGPSIFPSGSLSGCKSRRTCNQPQL